MFNMFRSCLLIILLIPVCVGAQQIEVNEQDLNYEILDIKLRDATLYQSAEFLTTYDGQILGSIDLLESLLEINLEYNPTSQRFSGNFSNIEVNITLEELSQKFNTPIYWSNTSLGLYFDFQILSELLNAKLDVDYSTLSLKITPNQINLLFPIEIRKQRESRQTFNLSRNSVQYDFLVEDQYRLYTPPKGQVSLSLTEDENGSSTSANISLYGDALYHATNLNLDVNSQESDVKGRLKLSRDQTSPNHKILGVLNNYSFGDVSNTQTRFGLPVSGLGFSLSTVDKRFVNYYGKTTIEENVPANWQVELYKFGYLIAINTSTEDGRVIFEDLDVDYGTNRFVLKLYGPYGEVETRNVDIVVGSQIIKQGNVDFSVNVVDQNKSVFGNNNSSTDSDFNPTINIQTNLGLGNKTSIGIGYLNQKLENTEETNEQYILSVSKSLSNSLLDLSAIFDDNKYNYNLNMIGSTGQSGRYRINAQSTKSETDTNHVIGGYFSTRLSNFNLSLNSILRQRQLSEQTIDFQEYSINLAKNILDANVSNTLNYSQSSINDSEVIDGELAVSKSFYNSLITSRLSLGYSVKNNTLEKKGIQSARFSMNWRTSQKLNGALGVTVFNNDEYQISNQLAWRKKQFNLVSNLNYSSNEEWSIGIGISFNLDYDYYRNKLNIQSEYSARSATLDLFTFADKNKSGHFDEWDSALEGVKFGPSVHWQDLGSSNKGYSYLPAPQIGRPFKLNYDTSETQSDLLSPVYDKVYFYTHAGGVTSFDVPFNYNTYVDGYVINSSTKSLAGSIPLQLLTLSNKVVKEFNTDFNNAYSLEQIWPGKYKIRIAPSYLEKNKLQSIPKELEFNIKPEANAVELKDFELVDEEAAPYHELNQLAENEFFTIQFGAYNSEEYCALRVEQLKGSGYKDAFYSMAATTCKVLVGEYSSENEANQMMASMPKELVQDGFATIYRTGDDIYAINITSYSVQLSAVTKKNDCNIESFSELAKQEENLYVLDTGKFCKLYLGDFISAQNARERLKLLPSNLKQGAFIVKH